MTEYNRVFVDTAPFIYYIEKDENNPHYFEKLKYFLMNSMDSLQLASACLKNCDLFLTNDKQLK